MFRIWKLTQSALGFALLMDAPDAGSGGGGADPGDPGDGSQPSEDVVAGEDGVDQGGADGSDAGREEALEDLLLDEDDDDQAGQRTIEDRYKAITKKHRKVKRQLAKLLPLAQRLKGVDLDDLVGSKRKLAEFNDMLSKNPRIRALLNGEADPAQETRRTPPKEDDPEFDEKALPFDPNANPANRYFADLAKQNFELSRTVKKLTGRLDGFDTQERSRSEAATRQSWQSTGLAAAAQIKDDGIRDTFKDLIALAYRDPEMRKHGPQKVVAHYLRKLNVAAVEAAKANKAAAATGTPAVRTAATQQRIAEANKHLPRSMAATGTPAPANGQRKSLAQLGKALRTGTAS